MAEESRWSHFLKGFRDSLTLVREVAILAILAALIFDASRITPILTKIGLALEKLALRNSTLAVSSRI